MTKILILSSDQDWREILPIVFEREGYECVIATTVQETMSHLKPQDIDVMVFHLPLRSEPNGWDFYVGLKADPKFYRIPVVVYTRRFFKESMPNPRDYGDQLLEAVMDIRILLDAIKGFLRSS